MKILTGKQIREADRITIEHEGITKLELMERASEEIARWIAQNVEASDKLVFCCGKGGNGGDGLAVARMLAGAGRECAVFLGADYNDLGTETRTNVERLPDEVEVYDITAERPDIDPDDVIVDALLGTGLTGEVREPARSIIKWMNGLPNRVIAIDVPSGMASGSESGSGSGGAGMTTADASGAGSVGSIVVLAETTLTLEFPKLELLLPETGESAGNVVVLPIGLDENFIADSPTPYHYITEEWIEKLLAPQKPQPALRSKFSHKGTFGHALLVCGSASMPGAAILAAGGALRSGCGLVTAHIPHTERFALTANHPSAMLSLDDGSCFSRVPENLERFSAIGIGPGLGQDEKTALALGELLEKISAPAIADNGRAAVDVIAVKTPAGPGNVLGSTTDRTECRGIRVVLDADALNIIASNSHLKRLIPAGSILTPHPGELKRLVGGWANDRQKLEKALALAHETRSVVVVKGAHSVVCTPDGRFIFNSTGDPGMAKGGSGDVLTGLLTGLLARGYDAVNASILGVYAHGGAGEKAAEYYGPEAMNSSDLAEFIRLDPQ